jgi:ABC-2 type transport system permease protein
VADGFAGTGALIRLALRRDRLLLPAWIVGFSGMAYFSASATVGLYPDETQRVAAAEAVNSASAIVALYGPIYDPTSLGELSLFKLTAFGAALTAVLMIFLVIRHTRADEEAGRLELMAAGRLGRYAPLAAAVIVACGASLLLGLLSATTLIAAGLAAAGSFAFGLGWAFTGVAFAAVAAICAQITTGARAARGLALLTVAVAYAVRALGDVSEGTWLTWLSPIGWMQQVRAYAGDRWWVLLLPAAMAVVCLPVAFWLRGRRDVGAGLVSDRPGPATGRVAGVFGLAWRLQRGSLLAWCLGFLLFSLLLGSVSDTLTGFLDSPQVQEFLEQLGGTQALADAFLATELSFAGIIVAAYGISAADRLRSEEIDGHAELLLATPASRLRWAASHTLIALVGVVVILLVSGAAMGVGNALAVGEADRAGSLLTASLARVPAAWVMVGVALMLFGWLPRWVPAIWGIFVVAFAVGEFGLLWSLPQWLMDASPFVHSPRLPAADATTGGLLPLTLVAVVLLAVGLVGWRRRDLRP